MPKVDKDYAQKKKDCILDACQQLYEKSSYKDVTMKDIAAATCSCSRPTIYNYFETIEEIFLGLLTREYTRWTEDLGEILKEEDLPGDELARALAKTLTKRITMLRIQSTNLYELEDHSRMECLVQFKEEMLQAMDTIDRILQRFRPDMSGQERVQFGRSFFALLYGIYPCTTPTKKQCAAMEQVGMEPPQCTVEEFAFACIKKLL